MPSTPEVGATDLAQVNVHSSHLQQVCPQVKTRIMQANQFIMRIPLAAAAAKGQPDVNAAEQALNSCQVGAYFFKCPPAKEGMIVTKLAMAKTKLLGLSASNPSIWVELAYNRVHWAHAYSQRCINPKLALAEEDMPALSLKDEELANSILEDDETELIKLTFSDDGKEFGKDWKDFKATLKTFKDDAAVKDVKTAWGKLFKTEAGKDLWGYHKRVMDTQLGKEFKAEI